MERRSNPNLDLQYLPILDGRLAEPAPRLIFLVALNAFGFSYCLVVSTLGIVVLPSEAELLFPRDDAIMLGVMLAATGATQLIAPLVGYLSDRSTWRFGRRRGLMLAGAALACSGFGAMWLCRQQRLGAAYVCALTAAVSGVNVIYSCYTALLPDFIPPAHMGLASGVMAAMSMLGSFGGFWLFGFRLQVSHAYGLYAAVTAAAVGVTCVAAPEAPLLSAAPVRCREMLSSCSIDVGGSPDFFWVFRVADPKFYTSLLAMVGQLSAAAVALPAGRLSDQLGRKPLVYASCALMGAVYVGFTLQPPPPASLRCVCHAVTGGGVFLSVDYALAYVVVMLSGAVYVAFAALLLRNVREKSRRRGDAASGLLRSSDSSPSSPEEGGE
ncbi:hypothetical protein EMIHUDRAFT_218358 [Emiliania huxleyi CCMP1516]|uniref:Major facilitator superfamily (MFS) profile domain-containing protein n=2 Tax=Emiliania huxleyi TaxID=2903 RepID=A0A0D3I856_EMIH1|nr:hypothetical protein EMIHUDRAFT_218358 [Emiliania huxleyi CCMP1516]EOD07441.1 hypothetical protein EMIHUDRAFT_218358 [Emiliania huxleyi CCMP1516]|eukprot:XP_005759870.1 hypothetical protein EMIHUDRAFT_218358 [Emiliania huxleyi CCMP1516]